MKNISKLLNYLVAIARNNIFEKNILPLELILYITKRCNLSCEHCFIDDNDRKANNELNIDELKKISLSFPRLISLMITGGEPFLREDLSEIIKVFDRDSKPMAISIITNAQLVDNIEDQLNRLIGAKLDSSLILNLSVDGDEKTHNEIRCNNKAYSNLKKTLKMLKMHPLRKKLSLGINITFSERNEHVPWSVYSELMKEENIDYCSINLARDKRRGGYKTLEIKKYMELANIINKNCKLKIDNLYGVMQYLYNIKEKYQIYLINKIYNEDKYQNMSCVAGRNIAVIDNVGDVYPCEYSNVKMGSIRNEEVSTIFNKPENLALLNKIKRDRCFCHNECFLSASINTSFLNQLKSIKWSLSYK